MSDGYRLRIGPSERQLAKILVAFVALFVLGILGQQSPARQHLLSYQEAAVHQPVAESQPSNGPAGEAAEVGWGTWPDWAIVGFTLMLTLLGYVQYRLAVRTARDTAESIAIARQAAEASIVAAEAASAQIALARKAYLIENRPWVGVIGERIGDLIISEDGEARLDAFLKLKNTGGSPAHGVAVKARLIAEDRAEGTAADVRERFAHRPRSRDDEDAVTCLFPDQEWEMKVTLVCPADVVRAVAEDTGVRALIFSVAGFVTYRSDSLESEETHASSYIYRVFRLGPSRILWPGGLMEIPADQLRIGRWPEAWQAD